MLNSKCPESCNFLMTNGIIIGQCFDSKFIPCTVYSKRTPVKK